MNNEKLPILTVQMASGGHFCIELHPEWAPNACACLIKFAKDGAYNGMQIERIVPGFVVQPRYKDEGRPDIDCLIHGEFRSNGFEQNPDIHEKTVAMAGDGKKFSSGSQFFITMGEHERLCGAFTAVGEIIHGWDEVKRIESVETAPVVNAMGVSINEPVVPEIIEKITVETFGVQYPEPVIYKWFEQ